MLSNSGSIYYDVVESFMVAERRVRYMGNEKSPITRASILRGELNYKLLTDNVRNCCLPSYIFN